MRPILSILVVTVLSGCLHAVNYDDSVAKCGAMNLYYAGFDVTGQVDGHDVGNLKCARAETPAQQCELEATKKRISAARAFEASWAVRRWTTNFGYLLYVVPGAGLYYAWKDENDADYRAYADKVSAAEKACETVAH